MKIINNIEERFQLSIQTTLSKKILEFINSQQNILDLFVKYEKKEPTINENKNEAYCSLNIKKIMWDEEKVCIIILADITQKINIDRMIKLNKYKDDILATVSHDLRSPLNGSLNYLAKVEKIINSQIKFQNEKLSDKEEILVLIKKSQKNQMYLLSLISDILDLSQAKEKRL